MTSMIATTMMADRTWGSMFTGLLAAGPAYRTGAPRRAARRHPEAGPGSEPAEQLRLLRLVLLGRDRASIAQVGEARQGPRDLLGIGGRGRRRGRCRRAGWDRRHRLGRRAAGAPGSRSRFAD